MRDPSRFAKHVLTVEIVEDTPQAIEVKVTECLWAKTFREMEAADIRITHNRVCRHLRRNPRHLHDVPTVHVHQPLPRRIGY